MHFIDKIKAWWTFKQNSGHRGAKRLYVLDVSALAAKSKGGPRPSPAEHVKLLEQVARFAEKERIQLSAVLDGKELREVSNGGRFNGVTVYFATHSTKVGEVMIEVLKQGLRQNEVMVITSDQRLEERVRELGGTTMRIATFKKALNGVVGTNEERSSGSRRRPRRKRRSSTDGRAKSSKRDAVRDLVDLVD